MEKERRIDSTHSQTPGGVGNVNQEDQQALLQSQQEEALLNKWVGLQSWWNQLNALAKLRYTHDHWTLPPWDTKTMKPNLTGMPRNGWEGKLMVAEIGQ